MARAREGGKRRTREHVIADLSHNFVERLILVEGHVFLRSAADYGYDLWMQTFDADGVVELGAALWQLKASETWEDSGGSVTFDLDVRDYNLWTRERSPVILALYDASRRRGYWLHVQGYFRGPRVAGPRPGAKTVRVRIPATQTLTRRSIRLIRRIKQEALPAHPLRLIP